MREWIEMDRFDETFERFNEDSQKRLDYLRNKTHRSGKIDGSHVKIDKDSSIQSQSQLKDSVNKGNVKVILGQ
jgi:hypothetical protein